MEHKQRWLQAYYLKPSLFIGKGNMAGHIKGDRNRIADSPAVSLTPLTTQIERGLKLCH